MGPPAAPAAHYHTQAASLTSEVQMSDSVSLFRFVSLDEAAAIAGVSPVTLARAGREGRDAIRAALRELREAGYLEVRRVQDGRGRWRTETWVHDRPPTPGKPTPGNPASGRPAVDGPSPKKDYHQVYDAAAAPQGAAIPDAATAQHGQTTPAPTSSAKARRVRASGVVTWDAGDAAEAERLEAETSPDELAAAVAAVRAAGREPVPGLVAMELDRRRRAAEGARRGAALRPVREGAAMTAAAYPATAAMTHAERMAANREKRRKVLAFLRSEIWTVPATLQALLGTPERPAYRQEVHRLMAALARDGLVVLDTVEGRQIVGITADGQAWIAGMLGKPPLTAAYQTGRTPVSRLEHRTDLQRLRIACARAGWTGWTYPDRQPAQKKASPAAKDTQRPDALATTPGGVGVALEVERTIKTAKRYRFIAGRHLDAIRRGDYAYVIYASRDAALAPSQREGPS